MTARREFKSLGYLVAAVLIGLATAAGFLAAHNLSILLAVFFAAVAAASWYGGLGPGLCATALSYLAVNWFFVSPSVAFSVNSTAFVFIFVSVAIAVFSEMSQRAVRRALDSAAQVKLVADSLTDGFAILDHQRRVAYMSRGAEEYNRRYLLPDTAADATPPFPLSGGNEVQTRLNEAVNEGKIVEFVYFHEPWQLWFEMKASPTEDGGLAIYFRDITDRKQTEDELRKLASIIESSEDAVIGVDLVGVITNWNQGAVNLYGYSSDEAIGQPAAMLLPPGHAEEEPRIIKQIRGGLPIRSYDTVRLRKDGRPIDISLSVSPMKDGRGAVIGYSKIARDITDRKRAEDALREADRRKDDFLALLGHELRNPLAGIVNGVQVLNHLGTNDREALEVQAIIERQASHMSRLIDDLLDVSRIVRGKIVLHLERIDLDAVVRQVVEDHRSMIGNNGLAVDLDPSPASLWISGDEVRIAQVLGNLINNAVKFTDRGGRLTVRTRCDAQSVIVEVEDTGIGMSDETIAALFEPFAQAEGALERSRGGLGLGLAVVRGLVELHQGSIHASSRGPGRGSLFTIHLPLCAPPPEKPAGQRGSGNGIQLQVLIIDDNRDVSVPMSKLLRLNGHEVAVATDGPSGVELARQLKPEVVLCDIGLPGAMSGYGVAQALRADPEMRSTFLVAITGFGQEEDRRRAAQAGFDRHMTKPVGIADLLKIFAQIGSAADRVAT